MAEAKGLTGTDLTSAWEYLENRARRALHGGGGPAATEVEWPACEDPTPMLEFLEGRAGERKLRALVCACWRRCGGYGSEVGGALIRVNEAVDLVERIEIEDDPNADELRRTFRSEFGRQAMLSSKAEGGNIASVGHRILGPSCSTRDAAWALVCCCRVAGYLAAKRRLDPVRLAAEVAEPARQAGLLRDIFGNPFRPVPFSPGWRTDTALSLARTMYESRDFSALLILADALQDAGCDSEDILDHCRDTSAPHVRGCWVADLVLGKE